MRQTVAAQPGSSRGKREGATNRHNRSSIRRSRRREEARSMPLLGCSEVKGRRREWSSMEVVGQGQGVGQAGYFIPMRWLPPLGRAITSRCRSARSVTCGRCVPTLSCPVL